MARYYWRNNRFEDSDGNPMPKPEREEVCMPMVMSDMEPITSPIDGKTITSRSQLRYELAKHDKRIQEPSESPTRGKIRNEKFAAKRGLQVSEEYR